MPTKQEKAYHKLAPSTVYSGRRVYKPANPDDGLYGHITVYSVLDAQKFSDSSTFSITSHSHVVSCANHPVVNGKEHYCYAPINHQGDPFRTKNRCGCSNKTMGYILLEDGTEIFPALNPNWENPYTKQGRYYE